MKRTTIISLLTTLSLGSWAVSSQLVAAEAKPPNIIVIFADSLDLAP